MALNIQTNIVSLETARKLGRSQASASLSTSLTTLSSGYHGATPADDAAGLRIGDRLSAQIRSLSTGERSVNQGISMAQVAEGALTQQQHLLADLKTLAIHAADPSVTEDDRRVMNDQRRALLDEVDHIAKTTSYDGTLLLADESNGTTVDFKVGSKDDPDGRLSLRLASITTKALGLKDAVIDTVEGAQAMRAGVDEAQAATSRQQWVVSSFADRMSASAFDLQASRGAAGTSSRNGDLDAAVERAARTRNQILGQSGVAVQAQANQLQQSALSLLGG